MDDLISRSEAIKWFFRPYSNEEYYSNLDVRRALNAIPTAPAISIEWLQTKMRGYASALKSTETAALIMVMKMWEEEQKGNNNG